MFQKLLKKLRKKSKYYYRTGWNLSMTEGGTSTAIFQYVTDENSGEKKKIDDRITKKPIEVFNEIISDKVPKMNLNDLNEQIKLVEKRIEFLEKHLGMEPKDEYEALKFLEARKKFTKYKDRFGWNVTTHLLIDKLCKKYKLRMADFQSYYKNVPTEAIDELERYCKAYRKVREDEPIIKLIIDDDGRETRKDPIVLVSSPFGYWFYVIGAWDKEVEVIDELFYRK